MEGIADSFVSQAEPLFALGSLCSSLTSYLPPAEDHATPDLAAKSFALGLRLIGKFFERLPSEVLEDEVPRRAGLIKRVRGGLVAQCLRLTLFAEQGLNDQHSGDLRRAAVNSLVSAQSVLRDEQRLYEMVGGLGKDQVSSIWARFVLRSSR